jgi:hypothetical protein|tara:strand:+ start:3560 stop:3814 length:255 start_codon:yes stop_codon:yes gene_type:complete
MIDPKLELYYRNMRELFRTDGWKQLIEDLTANGVTIDSVEMTRNNEDLYFRKGQLDVIANIVNLEGQVERAEQEQLEDTDESIH